MTAIAIDDEPIALEIIKTLSAKAPCLELKGCFTNAFDALAYWQHQPTDLVFLDIKMPDISGMEWLRSISRPPLAIFTTAYSEHAVESFELDAVDYLLKPFSLARFLKAVNKANDLLLLKQATDAGTAQPFIFVKSGHHQVRIPFTDILYAQSAGNYVQFVLANEKILSRLTMSETDALLPSAHFTRIHRSYFVANQRVTRITKSFVYLGALELPIGAGYSEQVSLLLLR